MSNGLGNLSDAELIDVAQQVVAAMTPDPTVYAATAGVVAALSALVTTFDGDLTAHVAAQAAAKSATATKEDSRAELEAAIRSIRNIAKANKVKPSDIANLGIPASSGAAPPNATIPEAQVDTGERLRHTIHFRDAAALGNKRRPRGAMGCEIWVKLGNPPPGDEKDCTFLTLDSKTPHLVEYEPADAGQTAHYMLRWRMQDGSVGAWGETESATITG